MPTTMPGISIAEAQRLLQVTDGILKTFPEVDHVLGKAGRAETATDPAPLSMLETIVVLKPHSQWRRAHTWYSSWAPDWVKPALRHITPDHISEPDLVAQMNEALKIPGVSNAWTMPIRGRIDMLTTGIRTAGRVEGPGRRCKSHRGSWTAGRDRAGGWPARAACSPSAPPVDIFWMSTGTATRWRSYGLVHRRRADCVIDCGRRRERNHNDRRPRALSDQRTLQT